MLIRKLSKVYEPPIVLTSYHKHSCKIQLNKPKKRNALCISMMELLQDSLKEYDSNPDVRLVFFCGDRNKAFCAGGNIRLLYEAKQEYNLKAIHEFFHKEYTLDYSLSRMKPVQLSIYEGIVMGGGAGISIHSPIRVATDSSIFAMPETKIGLYPDVAGSYFLPRLPGNIGLYLGLTGSIINGKELVQAGVATHFVPQDSINTMIQTLIDTVTPDTSIKEIEKIVSSYSSEVKGPLEYVESIDKYFNNAKSPNEILERLNDGSKWSTELLKNMQKLCPLSVKVTFEQLKRGKFLSLTDAFKMEYRLSLNFMENPDFYEGCRALLIGGDKNPVWQHKSLEEVSDDFVNSFFEATYDDLDVEAELKKLKIAK